MCRSQIWGRLHSQAGLVSLIGRGVTREGTTQLFKSVHSYKVNWWVLLRMTVNLIVCQTINYNYRSCLSVDKVLQIWFVSMTITNIIQSGPHRVYPTLFCVQKCCLQLPRYVRGMFWLGLHMAAKTKVWHALKNTTYIKLYNLGKV